MKVAYQGTKASFSEIAIERFFGSGVEPIGKATFEDVFIDLDSGKTELAAVPIENSLIGPIVENFDLFHRYDAEIIGELCLPIEHCLVGKNTRVEKIKKVYSHPKALAQCTRFFQAHPWIEPFVHFDTAGAAQEIAEKSDPTVAAIGSRKTAEVYQLDILKENLEDDRSNTTRFLFLQKTKKGVLSESVHNGIQNLAHGNVSASDLQQAQPLAKQGADAASRKGEDTDEASGQSSNQHVYKCSLLLTLKHAPGTLSEVLQMLALLKLNLMQIVSRPIKDEPFEYLFFIDTLFTREHDMASILNALKEKTETLKLLGLYAPSE